MGEHGGHYRKSEIKKTPISTPCNPVLRLFLHHHLYLFCNQRERERDALRTSKSSVPISSSSSSFFSVFDIFRRFELLKCGNVSGVIDASGVVSFGNKRRRIR